MRDEWIIDVLTDLRRFAQDNDLPVLAEQLDDTAIIATAEIASRDAITARRSRDAACGQMRPRGVGTC